MGKCNRYLVQEWIYRYGSCLEKHERVFNNKLDELVRVDKTIRCYIPTIGEL